MHARASLRSCLLGSIGTDRSRSVFGMTTTLPAAWYGDPAIHERERRAVFGNEWLFAGFSQSLAEAGDYLATDIAGWSIVVIVDDEGVLRAHHNVCRHRAGPL